MNDHELDKWVSKIKDRMQEIEHSNTLRVVLYESSKFHLWLWKKPGSIFFTAMEAGPTEVSAGPVTLSQACKLCEKYGLGSMERLMQKVCES